MPSTLAPEKKHAALLPPSRRHGGGGPAARAGAYITTRCGLRSSQPGLRPCRAGGIEGPPLSFSALSRSTGVTTERGGLISEARGSFAGAGRLSARTQPLFRVNKAPGEAVLEGPLQEDSLQTLMKEERPMSPLGLSEKHAPFPSTYVPGDLTTHKGEKLLCCHSDTNHTIYFSPSAPLSHPISFKGSGSLRVQIEQRRTKAGTQLHSPEAFDVTDSSAPRKRGRGRRRGDLTAATQRGRRPVTRPQARPLPQQRETASLARITPAY
ncbi:hypothetical protein SKAU_G00065760 [Synaphobranchus kaupii]|uniref:Uncharacterized protein n=1 Tax=Synaphobranchus kaupii TaxID=118154 RepID=A0A9Q1G6P7_SYNKA|nr:hypothetical protein SKAU_G00065760 [Synaphobranchus kaupii]